MVWLLLLTAAVLLFSFVILFGAPFLPTHKVREDDVFKLLKLEKGQTLLELGSGDGRILLLAAKKGIKSVGYELNPVLVLISILRTWRYRQLVTVRWGNYWVAQWPQVDGIYTFLLQRYMERLDKKIVQEYGKKVKLVSFAFPIKNRKPAKQIKGMYLYKY